MKPNPRDGESRSWPGRYGSSGCFRRRTRPNLNLIERLWKVVKKECLSSRYHEEFARFKAAISACLEGVEGKHDPLIRSRLTLDFQTFRETSTSGRVKNRPFKPEGHGEGDYAFRAKDSEKQRETHGRWEACSVCRDDRDLIDRAGGRGD